MSFVVSELLFRRPQVHSEHAANDQRFQALLYSFFQNNRDLVAHILADHSSYICPYRQLMRAIAESHKGTPEGMPIDRASHLYQATRSKKLDRAWPDDVCPPALRAALL